jgi:hypothetical protein
MQDIISQFKDQKVDIHSGPKSNVLRFRDCEKAADFWFKMQEMGLPVNFSNTC